MTPSQFKKLARLLKQLYAELEADALNEGVAVTSSEFTQVAKAARLALLEREGFTEEQYEEAKNLNKTEKEEKKTASETKADQFFERVEKIKGDKGETGEKGDPGKDGKDGLNGKDGRDGKNGKDGKDGKPGEKGDRGDRGEMGMVDVATIAYLEDKMVQVESKIPEPVDVEKIKEQLLPEVVEISKVTAQSNIDLMGMPNFRKLGVGLQQQIDERIMGVNTKKLTVATTAPSNPQLNDLWIDIS